MRICVRECQSADWKTHKIFCKQAKLAKKTSTGESLKGQAAFAYARRLMKANKLLECATYCRAMAREEKGLDAAQLLTLAGTAYGMSGDIDNAIDACQQSIKVAPLCVTPYFNLTKGLLMKGRVDEAANAVSRHVLLSMGENGLGIPTLDQLGQVLLARGDLQNAKIAHNLSDQMRSTPLTGTKHEPVILELLEHAHKDGKEGISAIVSDNLSFLKANLAEAGEMEKEGR